jgi:hypothetical protein
MTLHGDGGGGGLGRRRFQKSFGGVFDRGFERVHRPILAKALDRAVSRI